MSDPIDIREHRISKKIEKEIAKKARIEGYQTSVRRFLKRFLNEEPSQDSATRFLWCMGVLFRQGHMTETFIYELADHLGISFNPPDGSKNDGNI